MTMFLYSFINWFVALVIGAFASILYLGSKTRSARIYASVALFVQLWAIGVGAYFFVQSPKWLVFWNQYNHLMASLLSASFYLFSLSIPEESRPSRWAIAALVVVEGILGYLYFFTDIAIHDAKFLLLQNVDRFDLYKSVGLVFYVPFGTLFSLAFWNLRKKMKLVDAETAQQLRLILWGTVVGFVPATAAEIFFPALGYYGVYWLGPTLALGWIAFITYAIARHRIFNVRLVFAEVSILVMSAILFANIFLSEELTFGIAGRIGIFAAFAVVGGFFIRNIIQKEAKREELARLTTELQALNLSLEEQVRERTKELSQQKGHSEAIIENLTTGLVEYTNDFVIVRMNTAAERLLGVSRHEVLGRPIHPSDKDQKHLEALTEISYPILSRATRRLEITATGIEATVNEISVHYPRDYDFQVILAAIPGSAGKTGGFIKIIRDITEEKQVSKTKSEFISIAAHQLRTPLSAVKWVLGILLGGDRGPLPSNQRVALARAYETNEKMITLVNDLLNVARIEDGRFGYNFKASNIGEIIGNSVADIRIAAKQKKISVLFDEPSPALPPLWCDPEKVSLALHNLLENALHYTPEEGTVTVTAETRGDQLVISVADTGIGINASDIPMLFSKFFRAENAKKMRGEGTGLGLFIVKNIVARHGGTIEVQSSETEGTVFTINLPLQKEKIPEAEDTVYY